MSPPTLSEEIWGKCDGRDRCEDPSGVQCSISQAVIYCWSSSIRPLSHLHPLFRPVEEHAVPLHSVSVYVLIWKSNNTKQVHLGYKSDSALALSGHIWFFFKLAKVFAGFCDAILKLILLIRLQLLAFISTQLCSQLCHRTWTEASLSMPALTHLHFFKAANHIEVSLAQQLAIQERKNIPQVKHKHLFIRSPRTAKEADKNCWC